MFGRHGPRSTPEVAGDATSSPSAHLISVMMPTAWRSGNGFGNKWNNVVWLTVCHGKP